MVGPTDLRLSEREVGALKRAMSMHQGAERRRHARYMLPNDFALVIRIIQPGGGAQTFSASARDISVSGLGFFHGSYVHPGTACGVLMRTLKGDAVAVSGTVVRCKHLSGRVHEVGILFEHEVEVSQFVASDVPEDTQTHVSGSDVHMRVSGLVHELRLMVEQRAAQGCLLSKVGELAIVLSPEQAPAPAAPPAAEPVASAPAPAPAPSAVAAT